jgi:hypothetical protein
MERGVPSQGRWSVIEPDEAREALRSPSTATNSTAEGLRCNNRMLTRCAPRQLGGAVLAADPCVRRRFNGFEFAAM